MLQSRLHFFSSGFAPLCSFESEKFRSANSISEITRQMFSPNNMLTVCDPTQGKYLTIATIYRGQVSMKEVDDQILLMQNKYSANFVHWIPNSIKTAVCNVPPKGLKLSGTFIANTTAILDSLQRIKQNFQQMLARKAYLHWYTSKLITRARLMRLYKKILTLKLTFYTNQLVDSLTTRWRYGLLWIYRSGIQLKWSDWWIYR